MRWLLSLSVMLLVAGCCGFHAQQSPPPSTRQMLGESAGVTPAVRAACERVNVLVSGTPGAMVETYGGAVADEMLGRSTSGCTIVISGSWRELGTGRSPADLIFESLSAEGWRQEVEYAADGPDGTMFGLSKDRVLCIVRGDWDGGDDADSTYVPSDVYQVIVRCVEKK